MTPVAAVRQLEWAEPRNGLFVATSSIGEYQIYRYKSGAVDLTLGEKSISPDCGGIDEAKAAAQADYAARILSAIDPVALSQAAEAKPVAWISPIDLDALGKGKRGMPVFPEKETDFQIPLFKRPSPPCDSRTEALEEAIKLIENRDWPKIAWEETTEDMLENIVSALRALSEAGRSALKEEGET